MIKKRVEDKEKELIEITAKIDEQVVLNKHYVYISKAYTDRKRLKSYAVADHIPFFNNRLSYYLDAFDLDIKISLTESLGLESTHWGYDFESGGERKKTNISFNLAMLDLREDIYGVQSNFLVLDEVEDALDNYSIDKLSQIIQNEFANRFETIFIISHKEYLKKIFPKQLITVRDENRFSHLYDPESGKYLDNSELGDTTKDYGDNFKIFE